MSITTTNNITHIVPQDIQAHILSFLDPKGLGNAFKTCKKWEHISKNASYDTTIWRPFFEELYNHLPKDPLVSFRQAYTSRMRLLKNLNQDITPKTFSVSGYISQCFITTHYLFVQHDEKIVYFDRTNTSKPAQFFPLQPTDQLTVFPFQVSKDIIKVISTQKDGSNVQQNTQKVQFYDVSNKNTPPLLLEIKGDVLTHFTKNTTIFIDNKHHPVLFDTHEKKTKRLENITLYNNNTLLSSLKHQKLAVMTTQEFKVIDFVTSQESVFSFTDPDLKTTLSHVYKKAPSFLALAKNSAQNDILLIGTAKATEILVIDIQTRKHRMLSVPTTLVTKLYQWLHNEHFLVIADNDGHNICIWNLDNFVDKPSYIKNTDEGFFILHCIDEEKLLTTSVTNEHIVKIWNLQTLHGTKHTLSTKSLWFLPSTVGLLGCSEHIVWAQIRSNTLEIPDTSFFIDMRREQVIEKTNSFPAEAQILADKYIFDSHSYHLIEHTDSEGDKIHVFDLIAPPTVKLEETEPVKLQEAQPFFDLWGAIANFVTPFFTSSEEKK